MVKYILKYYSVINCEHIYLVFYKYLRISCLDKVGVECVGLIVQFFRCMLWGCLISCELFSGCGMVTRWGTIHRNYTNEKGRVGTPTTLAHLYC